MKRFIQLKLSDNHFGMFVVDTDQVSEKEALDVIKDAYLEHKDDLEEFKMAVSRCSISPVEPDLIVELEDLNADGFDVECHIVSYSSGTKHPELFAIGEKTWTARGAYDRKLKSRSDIEKAQSLGGFSVAL